MKYDTSNKVELKKARVRFEALVAKEAIIDMTEKHPKRTISQNAYVHVLFGLYGVENGYSIEEAKVLIKRVLGYKYQKNGEWFLSHTSTMTTAELTVFIDKFRNFSAEHGCYLPTADEYKESFAYYDNQLEMNKQYL